MSVRGKIGQQWVKRTFHKKKGRKDYQCDHCKGSIPKGTDHYTYATFTTRGMGRVHLECVQ